MCRKTCAARLFDPDTEHTRVPHSSPSKTQSESSFDHRTKCAWATFTNHRQELTSPKCPLRDKLFDATVAPSLLCTSGSWTTTEETKKKLQKSAAAYDEDDHTDKEEHHTNVQQPHTPRASMVPPTANHTASTTSRRTTRLNPTAKNPNEKEETSHDADSNSLPQPSAKRPTTECEQRTKQMTWQQAESRRGSSGMAKNIQSCWKQARMIVEHHEGRWTKLISSWNPAISTKQTGHPETGRTRHDMDDSHTYLQPTRTNRENNDLMNDTTWLIPAPDGLKWDSMEKRCRQQQAQATNTAHDPHRHCNTSQRNNNPTTNTHNERTRP